MACVTYTFSRVESRPKTSSHVVVPHDIIYNTLWELLTVYEITSREKFRKIFFFLLGYYIGYFIHTVCTVRYKIWTAVAAAAFRSGAVRHVFVLWSLLLLYKQIVINLFVGDTMSKRTSEKKKNRKQHTVHIISYEPYVILIYTPPSPGR